MSTAQDKKKNQQQVMAEAWQWVMSTSQGRLVISDLLRMAGDPINASPFHGQTNMTIKNTGMQDVGRLIIGRVKTHCFDDWQRLEREEKING